MKKLCLLFFALILLISCDNGVTQDSLCLYSERSVFMGEKEIPKQKSENIVIDRQTKRLLIVKHTDTMILLRDFYNPNVCIELDFNDGVLTYLYEEYLFNGKYVSRAVIGDTQKLVIFDIYKDIYNVIEIDVPQIYRICGLNNNYVYLYTHENLIDKINYLTLEEEKINLELYNPGYCAESDSFIGITENKNICIIKNGVRKEFPIKGVRYTNNSRYVDISNLYYYTGTKVYYAKKDSIGYIKSILNLSIFMDGLGPIKWYCYDIETNKSIKINNKGYSFLFE